MERNIVKTGRVLSHVSIVPRFWYTVCAWGKYLNFPVMTCASSMDMKNLTEVTSEPLLRASSSASKRPWQLISSNSCVLSILKPLDLMICDHTCERVMSLRTQQRLTISTLSIASSYNAAHLVPTPSAELPSSIWVCHYCMTLSAVMGQNLFNSVIAFWKRAMKNAPNQI